MTILDFLAPGTPHRLSELIERADPGARWGEVRIDGRVSRKRDPELAPGARVRLEARGGNPGASRRFDAGGLWALVPAVPWDRGRIALSGAGGEEIEFERKATADGVSELRLELASSLAEHSLLEGLSAAGMPVLGDVHHGGIAVAGGPRLARAPEEFEGWWPGEAARAGLETTAKRPLVRTISDATGRMLRAGHPWARPDAESDPLDGLAPGTWVELADRRGIAALARVEDDPEIAARVWARQGKGDAGNVEGRVAAALGRRRRLLAGPPGAEETTVCRLIHGEADGIPGLAVDRLGSCLRLLWSGRASEGLRDRVVAALQGQLADRLPLGSPVVEVVHLKQRPPGRVECVRLLQGELEPGRQRVRERGLEFLVDSGLGEPQRPRPGFGLFPDQRENRGRMAKRARAGGRFLNLFAHTGAFSVAMLAAGADSVVSVDLSSAYLEWLDENLDLNGIAASRHESIQRDGRRYLEALPASDGFDGIVLDPPTAAAAGRRYWSVRRDLAPLIRRSLSRVLPGGALLVCRNDLHGAEGSRGLVTLVEECAEAEGVGLASAELAGPSLDFPVLPGFPEGVSFHGCLALRAS